MSAAPPSDPPSERLKLALVTDIHYGPNAYTKRGEDAPALVETVVAAASAFGPDRFVELGDRLSDCSEAEDRERLTKLAELFARCGGPRTHLLGNHDIVHLSRREIGHILDCETAHHSVDEKGWHLVFWNADPHYPDGLEIAPGDLEWLEADLAATRLPSVVFSHVPLDDAAMIGNFYFKTRPEGRAGFLNAAAAREVIERSEKVVLAVAGHVHRNQLSTIDGIHYLSLQSLTESFTTHPYPSGAWATLELDHEIHWQVHGREPLAMTLPIKVLEHHWLRRRDFLSGSA